MLFLSLLLSWWGSVLDFDFLICSFCQLYFNFVFKNEEERIITSKPWTYLVGKTFSTNKAEETVTELRIYGSHLLQNKEAVSRIQKAHILSLQIALLFSLDFQISFCRYVSALHAPFEEFEVDHIDRPVSLRTADMCLVGKISCNPHSLFVKESWGVMTFPFLCEKKSWKHTRNCFFVSKCKYMWEFISSTGTRLELSIYFSKWRLVSTSDSRCKNCQNLSKVVVSLLPWLKFFSTQKWHLTSQRTNHKKPLHFFFLWRQNSNSSSFQYWELPWRNVRYTRSWTREQIYVFGLVFGRAEKIL